VSLGIAHLTCVRSGPLRSDVTRSFERLARRESDIGCLAHFGRRGIMSLWEHATFARDIFQIHLSCLRSCVLPVVANERLSSYGPDQAQGRQDKIWRASMVSTSLSFTSSKWCCFSESISILAWRRRGVTGGLVSQDDGAMLQ